MDHIKEPYYFDNYNTTVKSFVLPNIPKQNNFTSSIKPDKASRPITKPVKVESETELFRSNSLEPYFKPNFSINYNLYDSVFFSEDEDDMLVDNLQVDLPMIEKEKSNARDDYDNDVKFDFYL